MASSRQPASVQQRRVGEEALIANDFVAFTRLLVAEDGVLDVYIHRSADPLELEPSAPGESTPEAVPLVREGRPQWVKRAGRWIAPPMVAAGACGGCSSICHGGR